MALRSGTSNIVGSIECIARAARDRERACASRRVKENSASDARSSKLVTPVQPPLSCLPYLRAPVKWRVMFVDCRFGWHDSWTPCSLIGGMLVFPGSGSGCGCSWRSFAQDHRGRGWSMKRGEKRRGHYKAAGTRQWLCADGEVSSRCTIG
ncbi:uncharacterized protein SPSK_09978 [Sporothrix schenckii 1099-18]|uniref:Uncharacterized protein n=1 Tax=Sporothrix schenckii 1099-18 TaxID=1397361 RepID=A0A0F2M858_SPOSC|nr:uncharacterized protein SPSK_09978 [Sporothrix schenckii 1099-18]KJR84366.1 hypothetical protein SPSK_09978 [Sporothrix schenckii 1099-18]